MMLSASIVVAFLGSPAFQSQVPAPSIEEIIHRYEKGILRIEGVKEIAPDEVNGKGVITVRVETPDAREMVLLVTQEKLENYPVRVVLSKNPLPPRPGSKPPEAKTPPSPPACHHCPLHCPPGPEALSEPAGKGGKGKLPPPAHADPKKKPELVCSHCPLHCRNNEEPGTVVEPGTPAPQDPAGPPGDGDKTANAEPLCDVARKLRGWPPLKTGRFGCEEMLTTTNNPERIRWAIDKGLPHWLSKEMPGVKGNSREGISCPIHGSHSMSEFVCISWVKHGKFCPMKDTLSPKELTPQKKPSD